MRQRGALYYCTNRDQYDLLMDRGVHEDECSCDNLMIPYNVYNLAHTRLSQSIAICILAFLGMTIHSDAANFS